MPIQNLTNREPQFLIIGKLRKGDPKSANRAGKDLDYFRFTSDTDPSLPAIFESIYGATPTVVNCFMKANTTDRVFSAWRELRNRIGLLHRCDGEFVHEYNERGVLTKTATPCPTAHLADVIENAQGYAQKNPDKCQPRATLDLIIPELQRAGLVRFSTTSMLDITRIDAELRAIEQLCGGLYGIPLQLVRIKEQVSSPAKDGKRLTTSRFMVHIQIEPSFFAAKIAAVQQAAYNALPQPKTLPNPQHLIPNAQSPTPNPQRFIDEETGEIFEAELWDDDVLPAVAEVQESVPQCTAKDLKALYREVAPIVGTELSSDKDAEFWQHVDDFSQDRINKTRQWLTELRAKRTA